MTEDLKTQHLAASELTASPAVNPTLRGKAGSWIRRHRGWAAIGAVFAVGLAVVISAQLAPKGDTVPLSVHNVGPNGARAVSEILGRHGVTVRDARSYTSALDSLAANPGATLLLYDRSGLLDEEQLKRLTGEARRVVVVTPRLNTLSALDSGINQAGVVPEAAPTLEPGCPQADAETAGTVSGEDGFLYDGDEVCYRPPGSAAGMLASTRDGALTVLGNTALINNQGLDEYGHAALALRTVGGSKDLVWYLPGLADANGADSPATLDDLAPEWVRFLGPWLAFIAILAIIWRGRRLGPLVFEPLPVVVKAVETAEGRARLYHDSHAIDRARDNLRAGTLVRLAKDLRLGSDASAEDVAGAAARHLGRPDTGIRELLQEHPRNEARLVQWSQELEKLENEVRTR
ncbi:DUF4350 domain-containing protein [Arthrobacter sp. D1-29]